MPVTVNPIQRVNVRVGSSINQNPVQTTVQFIGASNPDISGAVSNAATAIVLAQSAFNAANNAANTANNKVDRSGDTMTGTLNIQSDIIVSGQYFGGTIDGGTFI